MRGWTVSPPICAAPSALTSSARPIDVLAAMVALGRTRPILAISHDFEGPGQVRRRLPAMSAAGISWVLASKSPQARPCMSLQALDPVVAAATSAKEFPRPDEPASSRTLRCQIQPNRELNQPILAAWRRSAMVSRRLERRCDERRSTVRLKGRRGAHPPVCDVIGGLPVAVSAREEDPELVRRPQMRRHSAPFRFLSIFRKESRGIAPAPTNSATARVTALGCSLPTASKSACDRWAYR